jgi:hypothetical protein
MERKHTESKRQQVRYILWKIFISNFNVWLSQNLFVVNKKRWQYNGTEKTIT